MDTLIYGTALVLILIGIAGSVLPAIPGPPLAFLGLAFTKLAKVQVFSDDTLVIYLIITIVISIADYYVPILGAKFGGGSRRGILGTIAGTLIGLFFIPWGLILGPFSGAILGELSNGRELNVAVKAGFGTFFGYIAGLLAKIGLCFVMLFHFTWGVISTF